MLGVLLFGGGVAGASAQDGERLTARVQAYWDLQVKDDPFGQYAYLEPRARGRMTPTDFVRQQHGVIQYLGAEVIGSKIRPPWGVASVRVLGRVTHPALRGESLAVEQVVEDLWVWVAGEWYRVLDPPSALPE